MARKDALLRLHKRLVTRRDALRSKLNNDLDGLGSTSKNSGPGDVGDDAYDGARTELTSKLASIESRELGMVERALQGMRDGHYGQCEVCQKSIPVARLQALPFAMFCVACQQKVEESGGLDEYGEPDWESARAFEGATSDRELTMRDIDVD